MALITYSIPKGNNARWPMLIQSLFDLQISVIANANAEYTTEINHPQKIPALLQLPQRHIFLNFPSRLLLSDLIWPKPNDQVCCCLLFVCRSFVVFCHHMFLGIQTNYKLWK